MSLRSHLDRYFQTRAMAHDHISSTPGPRSRSLSRSNVAVLDRPSPFFRPPGWEPPRPDQERPIIIQIDLKTMQQNAARDPYYRILAPNVTLHLTATEYDSLYKVYKVIYRTSMTFNSW